jgi:hypothetical protein
LGKRGTHIDVVRRELRLDTTHRVTITAGGGLVLSIAMRWACRGLGAAVANATQNATGTRVDHVGWLALSSRSIGFVIGKFLEAVENLDDLRLAICPGSNGILAYNIAILIGNNRRERKIIVGGRYYLALIDRHAAASRSAPA